MSSRGDASPHKRSLRPDDARIATLGSTSSYCLPLVASAVSSPAPTSSMASSSSSSSYAFATMSPGQGTAFTTEGGGKEDEDPTKRALLERRRKQRDLKRKSRARKKDDIETMKEQVRLLEAKYEQLYVANTSSTRAQTGNSQSTGDNNATLLYKYTQAREEMALLRTQIAAMKEKVIEYDRFSSAMESYLSDFAISAPSSSSVDEANPLVREEPEPFQPLSHATCFAIIQQCYQQIFHPQWRGQRISTGAQIFGWRDERFVDGTTLQFALAKPFENLSMEHMMHKTWDIVTTVEHMHTIQRSTIGVKVLQVVNDDILVTQRCVHHPQLNKVTCVNMLMFRLRTERGYVVAYVTIDHPEQMAAGQDENENQDEDSSSNQATFFDIDEYMKDQKNAWRETGSSGGKGDGDGTKKLKVTWVDMLQWFIFEEAPPLPSSPPCKVEIEDNEDLEILAASLLDPVPSSSSTSSSVVNVTFGGRMDNKDLHYVSYFLIEIVSMIMRWDQAVAYSRLTFYDTESDDGASPSPAPSASFSPSPWDSSEEYKWTS